MVKIKSDILLYSIVLTLSSLSALAQNNDSLLLGTNDTTVVVPQQKKHAIFETAHLFPLFILCHYPPDCSSRFDPQLPAFWIGDMTLHEGFMGRKTDGVPIKEGFIRQNEVGLTILQLSKGVFSDLTGATTALQVGLGTIGLDKDYELTREKGKIGFVAAQETLSSSTINYLFLRIPFLVGVQDRKHRFSLLSGLSLDFCVPSYDRYNYRHQNEDKRHYCRIHAKPFSVNWQVTAGVGPVTVSYSHSLSPLFNLTDETRVFPSLLSIGLDLWYLQRRY